MKKFIVGFACTTIQAKTSALSKNLELWRNMLIGPAAVSLDRKSPFPKLDDEFIDSYLAFSNISASTYERLCPWDSYSRKNIAFLRLANMDVDAIFETDDDNHVCFGEIQDPSKWLEDKLVLNSYESQVHQNIFMSIYSAADRDRIWARGYPLSYLDGDESPRLFKSDQHTSIYPAGVIQFLVNGDPDVDAIYRLVKGDNITLTTNDEILPQALANYHPFNSQATLWPRESFPLMYLPSTCSFRMTDIWRGYIAQAILASQNKRVIFDKALVEQERNVHRISSDFMGEYKGYNQSAMIIKILNGMQICNTKTVDECLRYVYKVLVSKGIFEKSELILLDEFLNELK